MESDPVEFWALYFNDPRPFEHFEEADKDLLVSLSLYNFLLVIVFRTTFFEIFVFIVFEEEFASQHSLIGCAVV
jgi:hypothetical protein